jgi:DNA-binding NarL/FixJ family response regulator
MDKMYCYLWYEKDKPNEAKFGERWVFDGQDPEKEVWKRIKSSVGVRKDLIRDGTIQLECIWDVTDYAEKIGRNYIHGKVDDKIRPVIGFRKGSTGEVHELPASEIRIKVNKFLAKFGQALPEAGLSQNQYSATENVIAAIKEGKRTIVAELCARFGKTIWTGSVVRETNAQLTIVASYVLTSFASFEKDLSSFEQFKDLVLIDTSNEDYQEVINAALAQGKQVVAFLSMCSGSNRQKRIDYLFGLDAVRLIAVDEADFGVHRSNQSKPLINARSEQDVVILMTGTNADKAASIWPVDHYLSVTYPELLVEKRIGSSNTSKTLKHFNVDPSRHQLYVDVEFYQMNLASVVEIARVTEPEAFTENGMFLPSWSKFAAKPVKAKGFFTNMLQAVFEGKGGDDSLNVDYQTERKAKEGIKVAMMFLPGSTTNDNLLEIKPIAEQALRGFSIVLVSGAEDMSNATAERDVKEAIERAEKTNQHVLILSAGMAQRSFSIPQITELYLAYDTGDNGATIQKMSRTLTPHTTGKIGRVISLSFDPNRDDKFDAMMIETAQNYKKNHNIPDLKQALRDVLRTVDIFKCQTDGSVKIEADEYLEQALNRKSIDRVIGKIAPINELSAEEVRALASGNVDVFRSARTEATAKGKTRLNVMKKAKGKNKTGATNSELVQAREMIVTISQNIDIIRYYGGSTIEEAFRIMDKEGLEIQDDVTSQFGVDYNLIKELVLTNFINRDLLDLKFAN